MNVPPRPRRAETSSAADLGWKFSGRSKWTTSSVIAKAKTPSVRASSRPFEINSLASAIILPPVFSFRRLRTCCLAACVIGEPIDSYQTLYTMQLALNHGQQLEAARFHDS